VLAVPAQRVWVAEAGGEPIGFVAATLRQSGMLVAVIETGGDLGHTPARRIYEEAGYTALPAVRFFKACSGSRRRLAVAGLRFWARASPRPSGCQHPVCWWWSRSVKWVADHQVRHDRRGVITEHCREAGLLQDVREPAIFRENLLCCQVGSGITTCHCDGLVRSCPHHTRLEFGSSATRPLR